MSLNKVLIIGNLGMDPELRYTPNGDAVCNFTVAVNFRDETTWFRVAAWRKLAENCNTYLNKGSRVYVEGRISLDQWTGQDGQTRARMEINATDIRFLTTRAEREGGAGAPPPPNSPPGRDYDDSDDLPW